MKKIRYYLFSIFEACLTVVAFILAGHFNYVANDYVILVNIAIWSGIDLAIYVILSLLFFICRKKIKQIYYFGIASGFFGIVICCLARVKSLEDSSFLATFSFIATVLSLLDLILKGDQKNIKYMICNKITLSLYNKIQDLSITDQKYASTIIESFNKNNDGFKLKDAASVIGLSENQTNKLLKKMINCGAVVSDGNTVARNYSINNK